MRDIATTAYTAGVQTALLSLSLKTAAADPEQDSILKKYLPQILGTAGLTAGALGGYKFLRRQRLSDNPILRKLQQSAGDLPFEVATNRPTDALGRAIRRVLYGAPDISQAVREAGRAGVDLARDATVLHHGDPWSALPVMGVVNINDPTTGLPKAFADKSSFAKIFKQVQEKLPEGVEIIPKTEDFADVMNAFGGDYEAVKRHLAQALPGGYLIKPIDESLGDVSRFINETTPADSRLLSEALKNPKSFILQEKLPIKNEFRVHTINGIPFTATHRRAPEGAFRNAWNAVSDTLGIGQGGFAHMPVTGPDRQALMKFVEDANAPLAEHYGTAPMHQAFDVAQLEDGTYRLIESNPTAGTFNNPLISRKLQETVTGRMHQDKAALGALGLSGLGGTAGYGAGMLAKKEEPTQ